MFGKEHKCDYGCIVLNICDDVKSQFFKDVFHKLNLIFEFADFSSAVLERAVNMRWDDCEDAIQSATAELVHADYIITRNLKDFGQSKVMAFTPSELLSRI